MKLTLFLCAISMLAATGCQKPATTGSSTAVTVPASTPAPQLQPAPSGPSVVPAHTIVVTLSPAAMQKLSESGETVIVSADYSGKPKPGTAKRWIDDEGQVELGSTQVETKPGQPVVFPAFQLKTEAFAQTDGGSPILLINVFSGRRSSQDNLLACDIYEDPVKNLAPNYKIPCKLIGE